MRSLMIGGTGTISSAITRQLAESGHELQVEDPEFDQWCDKVIGAQEQAKKMILFCK